MPPSDKSQEGPRKHRILTVVAVIILVAALFGIILTGIIWFFANQLIYSYGVILDAGSTSTKIYLYKWPDFPTRINGMVSQVKKCKASPGISHFEDNPEDAIIGIKICMDEDILPIIPSMQLSKTVVYLGATAGMRLILERDPTAIQRVFDVVGKYLLTTGLMLNKNLEDIKIISGQSEGVNAWITANYLNGTIQSSSFGLNSRRPTLGTLDLGGASTQITFESTTPTSNKKEMSVRLYGENYSVYSHSYLCYGKSMAELRLLALITMEIWDKIADPNYQLAFPKVPNPCMLVGDRFDSTLRQVFQAPCTEGPYAKANFGFDAVLPKHHKNKSKDIVIIYQGTGNIQQCDSLTKQLFDTKTCDHLSCSFNNIYRPPLPSKFLAFSGFYVVHKKLNKLADSDLHTMDSYIKAANGYCSSNAPTKEIQENSTRRDPDLEIYRKWRCFDFFYVFYLLKGYGFNESNWRSISFIKRINNANLGWSLGYMINKTALIPIEKPIYNINLTGFIFILVFMLLFILIGAAFCLFSLGRVAVDRENHKIRIVRHPRKSANVLANEGTTKTPTEERELFHVV